MDLLLAISEPRRRAILQMVWDGEVAAGAIHGAMHDVTFGAISQHLRVLADAGAVTVRREGRRRLYRADKRALGPLRAALEAMWATSLDRLRALAEAEAHPTRRPRKERTR